MKSNPMTALVVRQGESVPRVSTRTIAETFKKDHAYVLKRVKALLSECPDNFSQVNFALADYFDDQNKSRPHYLLTRDAFSLLVMGFTGKEALAWKLRYIEAFNALERELLGRRLGLAARLSPERRRELSKAARYRSLGLSCADVGKLMGCGEKKARRMLADAALLIGGGKGGA